MWKVPFLGALLALSLASPTHGSYNSTIGHKCALYSAAAYCVGYELALWQCAPCKQLPELLMVRPLFSVDTFTFGYVSYNPVDFTIIVAFKGTSGVPDLDSLSVKTVLSLQNWITNADAKLVGFEWGGRVHKGFLNAYQSVKTQVRSSVKAILQSKVIVHGIVITGHSLGGALAVLAAADLHFYNANQSLPQLPQLLSTFGAPRVGDAAFVKMLTDMPNVQHFRVTHKSDPIPLLPPLLPDKSTYVHTGIEEWYADDTLSFKTCANNTEDPTCSLSRVLAPHVADHLFYLQLNISNMCGSLFPAPGEGGCPKASTGCIPGDSHCAKSARAEMADCSSCASGFGMSPAWWGPTCTKCCPPGCSNYGCRMEDLPGIVGGTCQSHCRNSSKHVYAYWGTTCSSCCPPNCDASGCNMVDVPGTVGGTCYHRCAKSDKYTYAYWGQYCENECPPHCDGSGCDQNTGMCYSRCAKSDKYTYAYWGQYCENECPLHCDGSGCDQDTGMCYRRCAKSDKYIYAYWGKYCENECRPNCDKSGCDQDTGMCYARCAHGWWGCSYTPDPGTSCMSPGPDCSKKCPPCKDGAQCDLITGECPEVVLI